MCWHKLHGDYSLLGWTSHLPIGADWTPVVITSGPDGLSAPRASKTKKLFHSEAELAGVACGHEHGAALA